VLMASGFQVNYATSTHHHIYVLCLIQGHCGMYSIYLNMIKFATAFRHIGGFLFVFRCPQKTTEILLFIQLVTFCLHTPSTFNFQKINVREYRRGNQKWTIKRNWQHRVHKTKTNKTKP
jgi:hypothetical protein